MSKWRCIDCDLGCIAKTQKHREEGPRYCLLYPDENDDTKGKKVQWERIE